MVIPNNWNEIESKEAGEFTNLSLGGHTCKILDVREYTSEVSGNTSLKVSIDIDENNEFKDYFKKQYDNNTLSERKWPSGAVKYLSLKEEQMSYLKGFISAVEKSNNIKIKADAGKELDLSQFKGLKIAGVFGWEEYQNDKGEVKTTTKLVQFRSLDKLKEIKIPKVKLISGEMVDYEDYQKNKKDNKLTGTEITGEEIDKFLDNAGITL